MPPQASVFAYSPSSGCVQLPKRAVVVVVVELVLDVAVADVVDMV
jgi:hypothetical protein